MQLFHQMPAQKKFLQCLPPDFQRYSWYQWQQDRSPPGQFRFLRFFCQSHGISHGFAYPSLHDRLSGCPGHLARHHDLPLLHPDRQLLARQWLWPAFPAPRPLPAHYPVPAHVPSTGWNLLNIPDYFPRTWKSGQFSHCLLSADPKRSRAFPEYQRFSDRLLPNNPCDHSWSWPHNRSHPGGTPPALHRKVARQMAPSPCLSHA